MESYSSDCDVSEKSDNNHHIINNSNHSTTTSNQDDDKGQKERLEEGSRKRSSDSYDNGSIHSKDTKSSNQSSNTQNSSSNSSSTSRDQRQQSANTVKKASFNVKEFISWCEYIPMRLTTSERLQLVVLENALEVCEYTDVVDVTFSHTRKNKYTRILESLIDTLSISCGLIVSGY